MEVLKVNNLKKYYGNNTNITKALNNRVVRKPLKKG